MMEKIKNMKALKARRRSLEQKKDALQKNIENAWKALHKTCRPWGMVKGWLKSVAG